MDQDYRFPPELMNADAVFVSVPSKLETFPPKCLMALGVAVLHDKAIIVARFPGGKVSSMLKRIATEVIEIEQSDSEETIFTKVTLALERFSKSKISLNNAENN